MYYIEIKSDICGESSRVEKKNWGRHFSPLNYDWRKCTVNGRPVKSKAKTKQEIKKEKRKNSHRTIESERQSEIEKWHTTKKFSSKKKKTILFFFVLEHIE